MFLFPSACTEVGAVPLRETSEDKTLLEKDDGGGGEKVVKMRSKWGKHLADASEEKETPWRSVFQDHKMTHMRTQIVQSVCQTNI